MLAVSLAVALGLAAPDAGALPPRATPARPAAPQAAAPRVAAPHEAGPRVASPQGASVDDVQAGTVRLMRALIARDVDGLAALCPAPFSFDGVSARTEAEVRQRWAETLDRHPVERLRLYGVEVLPYPAMVQKYGKPPARLAGLPLEGSFIAVANLDGRATIVVWRRRAHGWQAVAVSD